MNYVPNYSITQKMRKKEKKGGGTSKFSLLTPFCVFKTEKKILNKKKCNFLKNNFTDRTSGILNFKFYTIGLIRSLRIY